MANDKQATDTPGSSDGPCPMNEGRMRVGYYAVCFLDVLGQKERLKRWPAQEKTTPEEEQVVKDTIDCVLRYRRRFEELFKELDLIRTPESVMQQWPPGMKDAFYRLQDASIVTQQFSDTFVAFADLLNGSGDKSPAALSRMIGVCAMLIAEALAEGVPIRGSITVGVGVDLPHGNPGNFYGPALEEVYGLSERHAQYPRVIVSEMVRRFLSQRSGFSHDASLDVAFGRVAASTQGFLTCADDGLQMVDVFGSEARSIYQDDAYADDVFQRASGFVDAEYTKHYRADNMRLAGRYYRLKTYMDARRHLWEPQSSKLDQEEQ